MAKLWSHSVTVQGRGSFPIDMLRYDCCWPRDQEAAAHLSSSLARWARPDTADGQEQVRSVEVTTVRSLKAYPFTDARWASFGWVVDSKSKRVQESGL